MRCKVVELIDGESVWKAAEGQRAQQSQMDQAQQERHMSGISEAKSKLLLEQGIDAGSCEQHFKVLHRPLVVTAAYRLPIASPRSREWYQHV